MSLLSGWDSVQPSLGLIHSLVAPGGLPALRRLSSPLSLHSCHFTRKPNHSSAHAGDPNSQFSAFFSSGDTFLSASKSFSPRPPADQMLGSLTLQAAR